MTDTNSSSIHLAGGEELTAEDAERSTRNYTPSIQETTEEVADEAPDKTEISADERKSLDERQQPTFQAPFADGEVRDRAQSFTTPSEGWESPVIKHRRKQAMMLPNRQAVRDLEERVAAVALLGSAPKPVAEAIKEARDAIATVWQAYDEGSHPDNPRYAASTEAKDAITVKIAEATRTVSLLERTASDDTLAREWFGSLTEGIEEKRAKALDALREAEREYAAFRGAVNGARSLAIAQGFFDEAFHTSPVNDVDLNRVLPELKEAIGYIDPESEASDGYTTGDYLVTETPEGEIPEHTLRRLETMGRAAGGGTFLHQLWMRAKVKSKDDSALQEALATRKFRGFMNSAPHQPRPDGSRG